MTSTVVHTPAEVAEILGVSEANVLRWRRTHGWPSLKVGRSIRFTEEHLAQILERHNVEPAVVDTAAARSVTQLGLTPRSARRRRSG